MRTLALAIIMLALSMRAPGQGPTDSVKALLAKNIESSSLTAPNSQPFHAKLTVSDSRKEHSEFSATIEISWAAPDKWRREIVSPVFSQTAIQNGRRYFETNSSDYFPWWLDNAMREVLDPSRSPNFSL